LTELHRTKNPRYSDAELKINNKKASIYEAFLLSGLVEQI